MALTFHIIGILKSSKFNKQEINTFLEEKNHKESFYSLIYIFFYVGVSVCC